MLFWIWDDVLDAGLDDGCCFGYGMTFWMKGWMTDVVLDMG